MFCGLKHDEFRQLLKKILKTKKGLYVSTHTTHKVIIMANMTLTVPQELHKRMKQHTELKWSDVARQAFERKVEELEFMEKALKNSKLTEEDAERIGHKIKTEIRKRLAE